jgi:hypothetical protein
MDQQVEASNAYGKRPNKLLWTGGGHANPGKRAGNLAKRMKANLRTALVEMLSKASHAHHRRSVSTRDTAVHERQEFSSET